MAVSVAMLAVQVSLLFTANVNNCIGYAEGLEVLSASHCLSSF